MHVENASAAVHVDEEIETYANNTGGERGMVNLCLFRYRFP